MMSRNFNKLFFCGLVVFPLYGFSVAEETATLRGVVFYDGTSTRQVIVKLTDQQGVSIDFISKETGEFIFSGLKDGLYVIRIELPNAAVKILSIEIKDQLPVNLGDIRFTKQNIKTTDLFTIAPSSEYSTKKSDFGFGDISKSPISISSMNAKMLDDMSGTDGFDVLMTGLSGLHIENDHMSKKFVIRGNKTFAMALDGVQFPIKREFPINMIFGLLESVELIKGPGGAFGVGSAGGLLNLRRKKPNLDKVSGSIRYVTSPNMFHKNHLFVDIGGPISLGQKSDGDRLATQWGIAFEEATPGGENPLMYTKAFMISPSIMYITPKDASVTTDMIFGMSFYDSVDSPNILLKTENPDTVHPTKFVGKDSNPYSIFWRTALAYEKKIVEKQIETIHHKVSTKQQFVSSFSRKSGNHFALLRFFGHLNFIDSHNQLVTAKEYKEKGNVEDIENVLMGSAQYADQETQLSFKSDLDYEIKSSFVKNHLRGGAQLQYFIEPSRASFFSGNLGGKLNTSYILNPKVSNDNVEWESSYDSMRYKEGFPYSLDSFPTALKVRGKRDLPWNGSPKMENHPLPYQKTILLGGYVYDQISIGSYVDLSGGLRYDAAFELTDAKYLEPPAGYDKNYRFQNGVSGWVGAVGNLLQNKSIFRNIKISGSAMWGWSPTLISHTGNTGYYAGDRGGWNLVGKNRNNLQVDSGIRMLFKNFLSFSSSVYFNRYFNKHGWGRATSEKDATCRKPGEFFPEDLPEGCVYRNYQNGGLEIDLVGPMVSGLFWGGNYSWTYYPKSTTDILTDWNSVNDPNDPEKDPKKKRQLANKGYVLHPRHLGSIWIKYILPISKLKGVGGRVSFRVAHGMLVRYTGEQIPTRYYPDLSIFYKTQFVDFVLAFTDLTNQRIWSGTTDQILEVNRGLLQSDGLAIRASIKLTF